MVGSNKSYIKKVVVMDEKSSAKSRAERLKRLRNLANLTRKDLCEPANINVLTYKGWELGRYGGLPKDGARAVIERLRSDGVECNLEWLLHEVGEAPKIIFDKFEDKSNNHLNQSSLRDHEFIIDELLLFRKHFINCVDYKVMDDGMMPQYAIGDVVAGIPIHLDDVMKYDIQNCIVQLATGELILRNLRIDKNSNQLRLLCLNPETTVVEPVLFNPEITTLATVILHRKPVESVMFKRN